MTKNTTKTNGTDTSTECEVSNQTTVNTVLMTPILSVAADRTDTKKNFYQKWEVLKGGLTIKTIASGKIIPDQHVKNTKTGEMMHVFLYKKLINNADRYALLTNLSVMQDVTVTPPSYTEQKVTAFQFLWEKFLEKTTFNLDFNAVGHSKTPLE